MQSTSSPNNDVWKLLLDSGQQIELTTPANWRIEPDEQTLLSLRAPDDVLTSLRLQYVSLNRLTFIDRITELSSLETPHWRQQQVVQVERLDLQAFEVHFLMEAPALTCILRKVYVSFGAGIFVVVFMTRATSWSSNNAVYRRIIQSIDLCQGHDEKHFAQPAPQFDVVEGVRARSAFA